MNKLYPPVDDVRELVAMILTRSKFTYLDLLNYLDVDTNTLQEQLLPLLDDERVELIRELHQVVFDDL